MTQLHIGDAHQRYYGGAVVSGSVASAAVLFTIDTSGFNSALVQVTSAGTTCTITYEVSNDNTNWVAVAGMPIGNTGVSAMVTTTTTATSTLFPTVGGWFRARVSTYGSGTVTAFASLSGAPYTPVYSANAPTLAAGTAAVGDVGVQYRANATGAATIRHVVAAASTNATVAKASAGRVVGWSLSNTTASWKYVKLHNVATTPTAGSGVVMTIGIPPNGVSNIEMPGGIAFSTGISYTIVTGAADADATAVAANDVVGDIFYA